MRKDEKMGGMGGGERRQEIQQEEIERWRDNHGREPGERKGDLW